MAGWFQMGNPTLNRMITGGTPILGKLHVNQSRVFNRSFQLLGVAVRKNVAGYGGSGSKFWEPHVGMVHFL